MTSVCSLCQQSRDLKKSHIIPNFVSNWLKKNSATGFMVNARNASERVQGTLTFNLLCNECEEKFSVFEKYFSEKIFDPFHKQKMRSFDYNSNLELFLISVSWRVLKIRSEDYKLKEPQFSAHLDKAERAWREFLMNKRQLISPYENHLVFLDYLENSESITEEMNLYNPLSIDCSMVGNSKRVYVYVKFPGMLFVSSIYPTKLDGWKGTEIKEKGKITARVTIKDESFNKFLRDRAEFALNSGEPIPEPLMKKRMERAIQKDSNKFFNSKAYQIQIVNWNLKLREKIKHLPESITLLFDTVVDSLESLDLSKADNQIKMKKMRAIAKAISSLSNEEANDLNMKIWGSIRMSKTLQKDFQMTLEAKPLWITFMIEVNSSKEKIRKKIFQELERLRVKSNEKKLIAVFGMTVPDENFESGFFIPSNII